MASKLPPYILWSFVFFAVAFSAEIFPCNDLCTAVTRFSGSIWLEGFTTDQAAHNISQLMPMTRDAILKKDSKLVGNLFMTNESTVDRLSAKDISYISCLPGDYTESSSPFKMFQSAMNHNLTAVILYNTEGNNCGFDDIRDVLQEFPIYTTTRDQNASEVLRSLENIPPSNKFFVNIAIHGVGTQTGGSVNQNNNQNPLGPSPSTAVAMIILYSITGIITALFLVIIVTGAVRAHRHPDRYGPRDVLGRPRQSRARGLGRAILDTIPIVKFGEREQEQSNKPTDVELASNSDTRNVDRTAAGTEGEQNAQTVPEPNTSNQTDEVHRVETTEQQSGIAPAQPLPVASAGTDSTSADDHLGCSICTEDFEKGQDLRVLPCNHKFHPDCVDPWLLNVSGTCPLCRVDLRPSPTSSTSGDHDPDADSLAPPLSNDRDTDPSNRRRSALRGILSFRSRPNASTEERISALRSLREQRRNHSGDVVAEGDGNNNGSSEDVAALRRSRRISARLSGVFGASRNRRAEQNQQMDDNHLVVSPAEEAEASGAVPTSSSAAVPTTSAPP